MESISEEQANELIKQGKEEVKNMIKNGRKVTITTIEEKDKVTTITKIEPVENKSTSSTVIQITEDEININYL